MRLFVTGATKVVSELAPTCSDVLGTFPVPMAGNTPQQLMSIGLPMAADNGCYRGLNEPKFRRMLARYSAARAPLQWVAVPDVVYDGAATFRQWDVWEPVIRAHGFTPCLVLQNGMTLADVKAVDPPAVFVGGDDEFKEGTTAMEMVRWARILNRPAHMGRVNAKRRIKYAHTIGCTSFDGSGFSIWSRIRIPMGVRWVREFNRDRGRNG